MMKSQKPESAFFSSVTQGKFWFLSSVLLSSVNDALSSYLINITGFSPRMLTLGRSVASMLLPSFYISYMCLIQKKRFNTKHTAIHLLRGVIFYVAILLWVKGLSATSMATATVISFTSPLLLMVVSAFWMKEKVSGKMWLLNLVAFLGVLVVIYQPTGYYVNQWALLLVVSTLLFTVIDVISKQYAPDADIFGRVFLPQFSAALLAGIDTYSEIIEWSPHAMDLSAWGWLLLLGLCGNLLLYGIMKGYALAPLSQLVPIRYVEIISSCVLQFLLFNQAISLQVCIGFLLIVPANFFSD